MPKKSRFEEILLERIRKNNDIIGTLNAENNALYSVLKEYQNIRKEKK